MCAHLPRRRDERADRGDRDKERRDVDPIGASDSKGDDHDPGERWSPDRRGLKEDLIERHCCGQLLSRDEARGQGAAGGTVQRGERRAQRGEGVEVRDACEAELRPDRERDRARREADLRGNE